MHRPPYPPTYKVEHIDTYHGVSVSDPYRWLEDEASSERAQWIDAQNAATAGYLSRIPCRVEVRRRLEELLRYPRYYEFVRRTPWLFFKRNNGLDTQLVTYVQKGLRGSPEVLIDPTVLAADGTLRVTSFFPSKDGRYVAYGLSHCGSDWEEYRVKDIVTKRDLQDRVRWVKFSPIAWFGDGFYYSRYPAPSTGRALCELNQHHQVWFHRIGTAQSADVLVYKDELHPLRLHCVQATQDERFVMMIVRDYADGYSGNALWLLATPWGHRTLTPLVTTFDAEFRVIDSVDDRLFVLTSRDAPTFCLEVIDRAGLADEKWSVLIPGQCDTLDDATPFGEELITTYRRDATHRLCIFDQVGGFKGEITLPDAGVVRLVRAQPEDKELLWSFSSFTTPPTIYIYRSGTQRSLLFIQSSPPFNSQAFATKQIACISKDGARFPMFVVHRKGLQLDGSHPSLLYAYGGNGAPVGPQFDPLLISLLERGFVYAAACVRGGGEYGEEWHRDGSRERKQNAFNDCIAAGERLQAIGYTNRTRAAVTGSSNGGLLVGAVITQRPDLFQVALPDLGIMDMLRFQHFTIGAAWVAEYGSSADREMFPVLMAYSPLHNIRKGVQYPATLVTTSEHDDRVVPAHSYKFVATLQEMGDPSQPYFIRIETNSGHGAVSLPKALDERADVYAFLIAHTQRQSQVYPTIGETRAH